MASPKPRIQLVLGTPSDTIRAAYECLLSFWFLVWWPYQDI